MPDHSPDVTQAYQHCLQLARRHYENFPTASRLIRRDLRPAVAAIYAFARYADDYADEGDALPATRIKQLDAWEALLERCQTEDVDHPVFLALGDAIRRHNLPVSAMHDLLTAFRMDVSIHSYATRDELLFYCRHSANPVGRLILALHDITDFQAIAASDAICTALQLVNFWQDLSIDLPKGRCYLPQEWLQPAGLSSKDLLAGGIGSEMIIPALHEATAYTEALFTQGRELLVYLPFLLRLQIAATIRGGMTILKRVAASKDPMRQRPTLGRFDWPGLAVMALLNVLTPPYRPAGEAV